MRNSIRRFRTSAVWLACLSWLLPWQGLDAAETNADSAPKRVPIVDVRLAADGTLSGKLVDSSGGVMPDRLVVLHNSERAVMRVKTDKEGDFTFHRVPGGVYQVRTDEWAVGCRVWPARVAPPAAKEQLLVVLGAPVVRGQQPIGAAFSSPVFVGLVLAAAIAIPVAVHNANDDDPSGS